MQVRNIQFYKNNFDAYNKIVGFSYSHIKGGGFQPTAKMRLGTAVHNYLLEPSEYNHENREIVIPLANAIKAELSGILPFLDTELSVTCDMEHAGMIMPYKGRVDMVRSGKIVIDLKVSEMPLARSIAHFGYDYQVNGYMAATLSEHGMIIRIDPKTRKVEKKMITKDTSWWEMQILRLGVPKEIY